MVSFDTRSEINLTIYFNLWSGVIDLFLRSGICPSLVDAFDGNDVIRLNDRLGHACLALGCVIESVCEVHLAN